MKWPRFTLQSLLLSTGFGGAAIGLAMKVALMLIDGDVGHTNVIEMLAWALAIGPLSGAAFCAPYGWRRCRWGVYVGFFAGVLFLAILTAIDVYFGG